MSPARVERLKRPSRAEFEKRHLRRLEPVILQGLFAGQPIDRIRTQTQAVRAFGGMKLDLQEQYFGPIRRGEERPIVSSRLRRYLAARGRERSLVCVEQIIPPELQALLHIPDYCLYRYREDGRDGVLSRIFIAHRGEVAHLHFDTDFNHVLLHQVFGRKRVILFRPEMGKLFNPILNVGSLALEDMEPKLRERFIAAFAAYDFLLHPGETAYIPPLMWHHIEYVDTGMSCNFRFGRGPEANLFERLHPSWRLQAMGWKWLAPGANARRGLRMYRQLLRQYEKWKHRGMAAYHALDSAITELYCEFCEDDPERVELWIPPVKQIEIEVERRIRQNILYSRKVPPLEPVRPRGA